MYIANGKNYDTIRGGYHGSELCQNGAWFYYTCDLYIIVSVEKLNLVRWRKLENF